MLLDSFSYTYRRRHLDESLRKHERQFVEPVFEIGNGSRDRRGRYRPTNKQQLFLDLSASKKPSVVGTGEALPIGSGSIATLICLEVLEHVQHVEKFVQELYRVTKLGGRLFLSMPFLYRFHAAPYDFQRYTEPKLRELLISAGFTIETVDHQGHYFTVLAEQLKSGFARIPSLWVRRLLGLFVLPALGLIRMLDFTPWVRGSEFFRSYTTGFFVVAQKNTAG